jgi:hypothetical protein
MEVAADWDDLRSPENYVGFERTENFASPGAVLGKRRVYAAPAQLQLNQWALAGEWTVEKQSHRAGQGWWTDHKSVSRTRPASDDGAGCAWDYRPISRAPGWKAPGAAHGVDVDEKGNGTVTEQRMYQLIRQPKPIVDRRFEIEFLDPGVEAFSFTFG